MEQKLVKVPFEVEMAKKITNGEIEGRIFDDYYKCSVRIVDFNFLSSKGKFNVAISERGEGKEVYSVFNDEGIIYLDREDKLDKTPVFMLEIPEYMTFKDGDIVACGWEEHNESSSWISIIKSVNTSAYGVRTSDYVILITKSNSNTDGVIKYDSYTTSGEWIRKATEEEKQTLIDALKESKEPKAKEYLKRFFNIEVKPECKFKAGQPVIGIDGRGEWRYDLFSHYKPEYRNGNYVCSARSYSTCLPYNENTAHLIGTTGGWEE